MDALEVGLYTISILLFGAGIFLIIRFIARIPRAKR